MLGTHARIHAVQTPVFDGPMELLLFLVRKEGVDIREVPIAPITDAYLAHIALLQSLDLDVAGEFLVMAATLCQLKSRELLPRLVTDEDEAEEEDPRESLARRLLEYQRYKEAAQSLEDLPWLGRDTFAPCPQPLPESERPLEPGVDALGLLEIFYAVIQKNQQAAPTHQVEMEPYSLKDRAQWVLSELAEGPRDLLEMIRVLPRLRDRLLSFLAALEMARLQLLDVEQARHLGSIVLTAKVEATAANLEVLSEGA